MKSKNLVLLSIFLMIAGFVSGQSWRDIKTVEDVCHAYPEVMQKMLEELNLDYPGMERVKAAQGSGNIDEACRQLLAYYKNSDNAKHLRKVQPVKTDLTDAEGDTILENVFVIQNVRAQSTTPAICIIPVAIFG